MSTAGNLREKAVSGVAWTAGAQVARQVQGLAVTAVLSRLLTPREFGLLAMVYVVTNFLNALRDMGLSSALVQKPDLQHRHINAVFWVNCSFGAVLTLLTAAAAPLLAAFYHEPSLQPLTLALSLTFFIASLGMAHRAVLTRELDFRRVVAAEFVGSLLGDVAACVLAFKGFGAWSLIAQGLFAQGFASLAAWLLSSFRPTLTFERRALDGMIRYGANLVGFTSLNYWARNLDNVVIGHNIGPLALGIYSRAYSLMLLPMTQITQVLGRVMFATLAQVQNDQPRTRSIYLRATRSIALLAFPAMVGLFVVAEPFVRILYGKGWGEVVPILRVLCVAGLGQAIGSTVGWLYTSQGRTDLQFRWGIFASVVTAIAFLVGIRWGALGVAWSYVLVGYTVLWYPAWRIPFALIGLKFSQMLANLAGIFGCALAMGGVVWLAQTKLPPAWPTGVRLGLLVALGASVYVGLCHSLRVQAWVEGRELLRKRLGRKLVQGRPDAS